MQIPKIQKITLENDWNLYFYEHMEEFLLDGDTIKATFISELTFWINLNENLRTQVLFDGIYLMLGVCPKEKELRLSSVRLFNEIFMLDQLVAADETTNTNFSQFKDHVDKISQIRFEQYPGISKVVSKRYGLNDLSDIENIRVKNKSEETTKELLGHLNSYTPALFEKFSDFALSLTASYALLRIHLLKFLAILPSLDHDQEGSEVKRILLESLKRLIIDSKKAKQKDLKGDQRPLPVQLVVLFYFTFLIFTITPSRLLAWLVRFKVRFMAKRFIAGENIQLAQASFTQIFQTGRDVTLDQLGELVVSEKEADHYKDEVLKLVRGFSLHIKKGEKNKAGVLRAHVSIKVSALCSDFRPEAFDYTYDLVAPRLKEILLAGKEHEVFINIDAEHYHYRDIVFDIYAKLLIETPQLQDYDQTGIVIQAYLRDGVKHLREVVELAKERGLTMPIRLVKGAYWDAETVEANAHGYDAPEFLNKEETDINFRQMIYEIYKSYPHVHLCIASHNFSDHAYAYALKEESFCEIPPIEHQCLHMTYEALSTAMAKMNWATRNYVPIGSLIVGMAYLVRRIMENSSQVGVLTIMRSHKNFTKLLSPLEVFSQNKEGLLLNYDHSISKLDGEFINIPPLKTYLKKDCSSLVDELAKFETKLGSFYDNAFSLNGDEVQIISPSDNETLVGKIKFATLEDADLALATIDKSFYQGSWSSKSWIERVSVMIRAQDLIHFRRNEITSLIMHESGKALNEALADVDEAIDFINFYIREQKSIQELGDLKARGPIAVIAPWNFPFAIPCGMAVSSLIAGNTVVLKSAEQTPLVVNVLVDILHQAGVPKDSLIHLPGEGETVGQRLVESEKIAGIIFTGSKPVGVHIAKIAGKRMYKNSNTNSTYPVKVITEMGGKNAVIVTNNAELDETVSGILYSAFAHAGQKCSAASRVIVDNKIKDKLAKRLSEAALDIKVGKALEFSAFINPLVSNEEKERLIAQVKEACKEASLHGGVVHVNRSEEKLPGSCVGPVIIELPKSRTNDIQSFCQRELFAPVLHIIGVDNLDEAIEVFNSTQFGLTGGIFSQSQDDIDYCVARMNVGSTYVNRSITGARVAIEPFGGFKMSGTGPKAGGVDYLRALHTIPNKPSGENNSVVEDGSQYSVRLARASGIDHEGREQMLCDDLDTIINNFGPLFPGVFGTDKERIFSLKTWLDENFKDIISGVRHNRVIPGQINYSKFDCFKQTCVYISLGQKPTTETFLNFLMAVICGLGVTVLCTNEKSYTWWRYLIDILVIKKNSYVNVECFFVNMEQIKSLQGEVIDVAIIDGDEKSTCEVIDLINEGVGEHVMTKFITSFEQTHSKHIFDLFHPYVNERSYAVNVMRHGAPMELDNL